MNKHHHGRICSPRERIGLYWSRELTNPGPSNHQTMSHKQSRFKEKLTLPATDQQRRPLSSFMGSLVLEIAE